MKTAILFILKTLVTNVAKMLVSKKMVYWTLETWAKNTDNKIDDNVVLIVEGAYDADTEKLKLGVEGLLAEMKKDV